VVEGRKSRKGVEKWENVRAAEKKRGGKRWEKQEKIGGGEGRKAGKREAGKGWQKVGKAGQKNNGKDGENSKKRGHRVPPHLRCTRSRSASNFFPQYAQGTLAGRMLRRCSPSTMEYVVSTTSAAASVSGSAVRLLP
jgi:hypothetical protein